MCAVVYRATTQKITAKIEQMKLVTDSTYPTLPNIQAAFLIHESMFQSWHWHVFLHPNQGTILSSPEKETTILGLVIATLDGEGREEDHG